MSQHIFTLIRKFVYTDMYNIEILKFRTPLQLSMQIDVLFAGSQADRIDLRGLGSEECGKEQLDLPRE